MARQVNFDKTGTIFESARQYLTAAKNDPNDATSVNLMFGLNQHFLALHETLGAMGLLLNELSERCERLEVKITSQSGPMVSRPGDGGFRPGH